MSALSLSSVRESQARIGAVASICLELRFRRINFSVPEMDLPTFLAGLFKNLTDLTAALGWPVAIMYCVHVFRADLRSLISRLRKAGVGPASFDFDKAVKRDEQVEQLAKDASLDLSPSALSASSRSGAPPPSPDNKAKTPTSRQESAESEDAKEIMRRLDESNFATTLRDVVDESWHLAHDGVLQAAAQVLGRPLREVSNLDFAVSVLTDIGVMQSSDVEILRRLQKTRDSIAQEPTSTFKSTAEKYDRTVRSFMRKIESRLQKID